MEIHAQAPSPTGRRVGRAHHVVSDEHPDGALIVPASMAPADRAGLARLREAFPDVPTVTATEPRPSVTIRCAQCHQRANGRTAPTLGRAVTLEHGGMQVQRLAKMSTPKGRTGPGYSQAYRTPEGWAWRTHRLQWIADDRRAHDVECPGWCRRPVVPVRKGRVVAAALAAIDQGLDVAYL